MVEILSVSLELGFFYALAVFGVFLTFRILNFPDLTVDGSFVTGAAATALAIQAGLPATLALLLGFVAGFAAGSITSFLHIKLGISKILSGILSLTMLYTINLRLMSGPNVSLLNQPNVLDWLKAPVNHLQAILILLVIVIAAKFALDWFLQTELGLFVTATGDNESTVKSLGVNPGFTKFIGVSLGNAFVALSGGFIAQNQGFADINMGIGIIILGLAAFMIGDALIGSQKVFYLTTAVVLGSVLYQLIINIGLRLGLAGTDLKLVTALIVIAALLLQPAKRKLFISKQ